LNTAVVLRTGLSEAAEADVVGPLTASVLLTSQRSSATLL
jgi:hypothetical protein